MLCIFTLSPPRENLGPTHNLIPHLPTSPFNAPFRVIKSIIGLGYNRKNKKNTSKNTVERASWQYDYISGAKRKTDSPDILILVLGVLVKLYWYVVPVLATVSAAQSSASPWETIRPGRPMCDRYAVNRSTMSKIGVEEETEKLIDVSRTRVENVVRCLFLRLDCSSVSYLLLFVMISLPMKQMSVNPSNWTNRITTSRVHTCCVYYSVLCFLLHWMRPFHTIGDDPN